MPWFARWLTNLGCLAAFVSSLVPLAAAEPAEFSPEQLTFFESKVRPLLAQNCAKCHGDAKQNGHLRLDSRAAILAGGDSGPAVVPGKPAESVLIKAINYQDYEMPPTGKLKDADIKTLTEWVKMGAPWRTSDAGPAVRKAGLEITDADRKFWSFLPAAKAKPPELATGSLAAESLAAVVNAVDRFIVARLHAAGLVPSAPATRRELIRRVSFDVTGLPPANDDVDSFERDDSPDAYERLVDRLLASPRYGERWGRHWLDLVRFAESNGYERDDEKPLSWRYRDYVIRALNGNKPYDQFIKEHLAGDEMQPPTDDSITATAYYRLGVWDDEPDDKRAAEFDELDDVVSTTGSAFLGLSVGCARCHDHKFDPIGQEDYYAMLAFLRDVSLYGNGNPNDPGPEGIFARLPSGKGTTLAVRQRRGAAQSTNVLVRGNPATPGKKVEPAYPQVLSPVSAAAPTFDPPADKNLPPTFGRRTALANWIARPDHPLTPRVMVNRLWHYHFGRGIVPTPSDFGRTGQKPSHPELLDFLATEFVDAGWDVKRIHRLILTSGVYRQSSVSRNEHAINQDPDNTLLWRQNLRRLEAEAIRDNVLFTSGQINYTMGGHGVYPTLPPEVLATQSRPGAGWDKSSPAEQARRSVYIFVKRTLGVPMLETFDAASPDKTIPARTTTTIAPQALILLNSEFMEQQAKAFAQRIRRQAGDDRRQQVNRAFELALARQPRDDEREIALAYLARLAESASKDSWFPAKSDSNTLAALCKLMLNLNEFIYID